MCLCVQGSSKLLASKQRHSIRERDRCKLNFVFFFRFYEYTLNLVYSSSLVIVGVGKLALLIECLLLSSAMDQCDRGERGRKYSKNQIVMQLHAKECQRIGQKLQNDNASYYSCKRFNYNSNTKADTLCYGSMGAMSRFQGGVIQVKF